MNFIIIREKEDDAETETKKKMHVLHKIVVDLIFVCCWLLVWKKYFKFKSTANEIRQCSCVCVCVCVQLRYLQ